MLNKVFTFPRAANGSACSHDIGAGGRAFSGKLSGTATNMKNTSKTAIAVANATARFSPYVVIV